MTGCNLRQAHGELPRLDSESEVAAVVYGPTDDPDHLLWRFAHDQRAFGYDVVGVLQHRRQSCRGPHRTVSLRFYGDPLSGNSEFVGNPSCDASVSAVESLLLREIERQPDLVIVNRFGTLEQQGRGFLGALAAAARLSVPVLIAVPERVFSQWIAVTCGMAVRLSCRPESVEAWWSSARAFPVGRAPTACELYK